MYPITSEMSNEFFWVLEFMIYATFKIKSKKFKKVYTIEYYLG